MVETRVQALNAGVDDFIVKPIIGHRLVARVAALFHKYGGGDDSLRVGTLGERGFGVGLGGPIQKTRPVTPRPTLARQASSPTLPTLPVPAEPDVCARPDPRSAATSQHVRPGQVAPEVPAELLRKFYVVLAERACSMEDADPTRERVRLQ